MKPVRGVSFEFRNQVSPRYIEPLLLQLDPDEWYSTADLQQLLRNSGINVQGSNIVQANMVFWTKVGMGDVERGGPGRTNLFRLGSLGKQVKQLYSTNRVLFFDVMHFLFYSSWRRSAHIDQAPFWLYAAACDELWRTAPAKMDTMRLTGYLQNESRSAFPGHAPVFPERSVRSVFPWLSELSPPFLSQCGSRSELCSQRRQYCTPQLFHLATDLACHEAGLSYGTSLAIDDRQVAAISRTCLLDPGRFWDMASLADMSIRELEVRQSQWGASLALAGPPRWIELPDFSRKNEGREMEGEL